MVRSNDWLEQRVAHNQVVPAKFGGVTWLFDARGVAWLPAQDMLVVSDLHLEKGSYLGSFGHPLPHMDSRATLDRLSAIIDDYQPRCLLCLGDSFHDVHAVSRMDSADKSYLASLIRRVDDWVWVLGNHDPAIPKEIAGVREHRLQVDNIGFCHEPEPDWPQCSHQVIGHFHPKMRVSAGRQRIRGRCFVISDALLVMPAFGQYTGGLWVDDPVMKDVLNGAPEQQFLLSEQQIFAIKPSGNKKGR